MSVVFRAEALADLDDIARYIGLRDTAAAVRMWLAFIA
jgi:plasmid stabilization system protein ParE